MSNKHILKDYTNTIKNCSLYILYFLLIAFLFCVTYAYDYWLADGDKKCMLAQDIATCAAIKTNNKE